MSNIGNILTDRVAHLDSPYNIEHTACSPGSSGGTDKIGDIVIISFNIIINILFHNLVSTCCHVGGLFFLTLSVNYNYNKDESGIA